jgi:hypothetical protein
VRKHTSTNFLSQNKFTPWDNQVFYVKRHIAEGIALSRLSILRETEILLIYQFCMMKNAHSLEGSNLICVPPLHYRMSFLTAVLSTNLG